MWQVLAIKSPEVFAAQIVLLVSENLTYSLVSHTDFDPILSKGYLIAL